MPLSALSTDVQPDRHLAPGSGVCTGPQSVDLGHGAARRLLMGPPGLEEARVVALVGRTFADWLSSREQSLESGSSVRITWPLSPAASLHRPRATLEAGTLTQGLVQSTEQQTGRGLPSPLPEPT